MELAQKPDFVFRAKRTSPLKSARRASVQSTAGSRGVRISGSNAGYTMFRGSVKSTGYPFHSPVSLSLPLPCVIACHHISTGLYKLLADVALRSQPIFLELTAEVNSVLVPTRRTGITLEDTRPSCRILTILIFCQAQRVQGTVKHTQQQTRATEKFQFCQKVAAYSTLWPLDRAAVFTISNGISNRGGNFVC